MSNIPAMGIQSENWIKRHQITVEQYYRMGEVGLLSPEDRVELIEGEVIDMAPSGSEHASVLRSLAEIFAEALHKQAIVAVQDPIRLGERSEPQPDLALLHRRAHRYKHAHPEPADVYLIVEVAQTSQRYDREVKLPLYTKYGIPEGWIIDAQKRQISIYRQPQEASFTSERVISQPGKVTLFALPDVEVDLSTLF